MRRNNGEEYGFLRNEEVMKGFGWESKRELSEGPLTIQPPKRGNIRPNRLLPLRRSQFHFYPRIPFYFPNKIIGSAFQVSTRTVATCADGMDLLETFVSFIV